MISPEPTETSSVAPLPSWLRKLVRARFVLLALYVLLTLGWYLVFYSQFNPLGISIGASSSGSEFLVSFLVGSAIVFGVQLLFLAGAPHLTWPRPRRRRSIFVSILIGSAIMVLLSAGIVTALFSLYQIIFNPASFGPNWTIGATTNPATTNPATTNPATVPAQITVPAQVNASGGGFELSTPLVISIALVAWIFWFLIFALVGGSLWSRRFRWIYRVLIAGTIVEMLITIPIDAAVRKRTNCYCGEGSFLSLVVGLTAILWMFGPGVAILFLVRRNQLIAQKLGRGTHFYCQTCGYDLHGLTSRRCPECGMSFDCL
jgi:hypothetical protein